MVLRGSITVPVSDLGLRGGDGEEEKTALEGVMGGISPLNRPGGREGKGGDKSGKLS